MIAQWEKSTYTSVYGRIRRISKEGKNKMEEVIGKDAFIAPSIGKIPLEKLPQIIEGQTIPLKKWVVVIDEPGATDWVQLVYVTALAMDKTTGIIINIGTFPKEIPCNNPPDNVECIWFMLDGAPVEYLSAEIASPALSALKSLISPPWWEEYKEVLCIAGGVLLLFFILAMVKGK